MSHNECIECKKKFYTSGEPIKPFYVCDDCAKNFKDEEIRFEAQQTREEGETNDDEVKE